MVKIMNRLAILVLAAGIPYLAFGSTPIASVSSASAFTLDGHSVLAPGVSSWPLVIGDQLTTSKTPALMSFRDGSRLTLAPKCQIKLTGTTEKPRVVLVAGNLEYRLAPGSVLSLTTSETAQDTNPPAAGQTPSGPAPTEVQGNRKGFILIGVLVAGGLISIIPIVNALQTPPPPPPISAP